MRARPTRKGDGLPTGRPMFGPVVLRGHLRVEIIDQVLEGKVEVLVLVRRQFRSLAVTVLPKGRDYAYPAGTRLKKGRVAILP